MTAPAGARPPAPAVEVVTTPDGVARVTVGTGQRRNALASAAWRQLGAAADDLAADDSVRAVVLRGRGNTFCAGSDVTEWARDDLAEVDASFAVLEDTFTRVEAIGVPVLAVVQGAAAGAGCQLALCADLRLMADGARIGMPIARLGILLTPAFADRIAALAGPETALDLVYTGRLLDAGEALATRLVSRTAPDDRLDAAADDLVDLVLAQPTAAARAAKRAVRELRARTPARSDPRLDGGHAVDPELLQRGVHRFLHRHSPETPAATAT